MAHRLDSRPAWHCRAVASRLVSAAVDSPITIRTRRSAPVLDSRTRNLVREIASANPLWGAPRIHGELRTLGIDISERTVSRLLPTRRPRPPSQTWRTFLTNHVVAAASMDFFTVPTV